MLYLKKANFEDAEQEYALVQKIPPEENGFENPWHAVSYADFLEKVIPRWLDYSVGRNLSPGHVPDTCYFLWDDDIPVGIFKLRHCLNDFLRENGGHLGYGVAAEYRGRGYATAGLKLLLDEARKLPLDTPEAYLSVQKANPASLKVILKNGGRIDHESPDHWHCRIKL